VLACLNSFIYHALQPLTGIPPFRLKKNHQHGKNILCFCRSECPYIQTFTSICPIFQASFHVVFCQVSLGNMAEENADPATVSVLTQSQNLIFFFSHFNHTVLISLLNHTVCFTYAERQRRTENLHALRRLRETGSPFRQEDQR
jgi:hypothetical protein